MLYFAVERTLTTSAVTLEIPEELAQQLRPVADRLPRILELGLRELRAADQPGFAGAAQVLELLVQLPSPQEILALQPSAALQARLDELLEKNQTAGLTPAESAEWEHYAYLEHLVRLAKLRAQLKLSAA